MGRHGIALDVCYRTLQMVAVGEAGLHDSHATACTASFTYRGASLTVEEHTLWRRDCRAWQGLKWLTLRSRTLR